MALKKYHGSCHCRKVQFEVEADLQKGTHRCNCSFCAKVRQWGFIVKPDSFKWISSQEYIGDYQATPNSVTHHLFCKNCGVRLGTKGHVKEIGGDYISVHISAIENLNAEELADLKIQYMDGLNNNWFESPKITKHL